MTLRTAAEWEKDLEDDLRETVLDLAASRPDISADLVDDSATIDEHISAIVDRVRKIKRETSRSKQTMDVSNKDLIEGLRWSGDE